MPSNTKYRFILAGILTIAAFLLRIYCLEDQSLWNDEMFSFDVIKNSLASIQPTLIAKYHHPPLFFYIAHFSINLFGETAWVLRFPSALFGALTVGLVFLMTETHMKRIGAIVAAVMCLIAPFHLAYSQEGRPYALAAFLCLLSCYAFVQLLQQQTRLRQASYIFSSVALLYTHHWGIFVLASHCVYGLLFQKQGRTRLIVLWGIIGVLYLPELLALRVQTMSGPPTQWFWAETPSPIELFHLATAFSGSYFNMASSIFALPFMVQIIGAIAIVVLVASGFSFTRTNKHSGFLKTYVVLFFVTLLIPFIISFFKPEVFLWYRYTVIAFPLVCIMIGRVIEYSINSGMRNVIFLAIGALLITSGMGTVHYFSWQKSNIKEVAAYVDTMTQTEAKIIIRPKTFASGLNYYYRGNAIQYDEAYLETPLGEIVDTAAAFVYISLDVPNQIRDYMDGHFFKTDEKSFLGEAHMGMLVAVYKQKISNEE